MISTSLISTAHFRDVSTLFLHSHLGGRGVHRGCCFSQHRRLLVFSFTPPPNTHACTHAHMLRPFLLLTPGLGNAVDPPGCLTQVYHSFTVYAAPVPSLTGWLTVQSFGPRDFFKYWSGESCHCRKAEITAQVSFHSRLNPSRTSVAYVAPSIDVAYDFEVLILIFLHKKCMSTFSL